MEEVYLLSSYQHEIEKKHIFRKQHFEEIKQELIKLFIEKLDKLFHDIVTYQGRKDITNTIEYYNKFVKYINEKQTTKKFVIIKYI